MQQIIARIVLDTMRKNEAIEHPARKGHWRNVLFTEITSRVSETQIITSSLGLRTICRPWNRT